MKPRRLTGSERESLTLAVTALGQRGEGLAQDGNRRIYIPGALPGETVRARLEEQVDRDVYRAALEEVTGGAGERMTAPCPHYEQCGGCALQHLQEAPYRGWKTAQVRTVLERAGAAPESWLDPVFIPHATRRRASFGLRRQGRALSIGFHAPRSHRLEPIDACLLLSPLLAEVLERSRAYLPALLPEGKPVDLFLQHVGDQVEALLTGLPYRLGISERDGIARWAEEAGLCRVSMRGGERDEAEIVLQRQPVIAHFGSLTVALPPAAFLQPSREGETALGQTVSAMLGEMEGLSGPAADLFAGCGTFAGILLEKAPVHAAEIDAAAVKALSDARAGSRLTVEKRNLFTAPLMAKELKRFRTVLLDPPRAGAEAQCVALAGSDVAAIIYVSCHPASFARDARALMAGGYRLRQARIVDQFVWSAHAELVGLFVR